jgi:hypothetical protein
METLSYVDLSRTGRQPDEIRALLIGRTVVKIDDEHLRLDDGRVLTIRGNDGCGGCIYGHYEARVLNDCPINAIMDVEFVHDEGGRRTEETIRLFVLAQDERIEVVNATGSDNGYYGSGFYIDIEDPRG